MPSQEILEWLADHGMTEVYTSDAVANPTSGEGAVLFEHTATEPILTLRYTFVNDSTNPVIYGIRLDGDDVLKPTAHPNLTEPVSIVIPVEVEQTILVGTFADPAANGTSRVVVEYISG